MSTAVTILLNVAGAALIFMALRDVFDVLFHERGRAELSHVVMRGVWRTIRRIARWRQRTFQLAGPFAVLAVIALWGALLILGWTLVYWPHMPDEFTLQSGVVHGHDFVDALYFSMVTLATIGFGDITPNAPLLRVLSPLEALIGLGLVTASISWLLSIYPVLSRRRSLAYEINLLVDSQEEVGLSVAELADDAAEGIFAELTSRLVAVERDLATLPVAYYFAETDERFALPATISDLLKLAEQGTDDDRPSHVRLRAAMLREAIDDFARTARPFHGRDGDSTEDMLRDYARDHLR